MKPNILYPGMLLLLIFLVPKTYATTPNACPGSSDINLSNSQMLHLLRHIEIANDRMGKQVNIAGIARFQLTVNRQGHVICAKSIDGHPIATSLLLESVAKWRFAPYTVNRSSESFCGILTVKFSIVEGRSAAEAIDDQGR